MDLNDQSLPWWRHAVCYQVYVRSFADSDGDGIGDLPGITSRLPYLRDLGVDALWITPFYTSPQKDHGYDVADYRDVDPLFGQLEDADRMIARAHEHGLRVIVDIVPNHSSDQHAWFQDALAAGPGSPERARYLFRDADPDDPTRPPNNWKSVFGGPAWTQVPDGQWYLHLFDSTQPDFDWRNPEVAEMFEGVLRFWLDRGVDGFRIDVAHGLFKVDGLPDQERPAAHEQSDDEHSAGSAISEGGEMVAAPPADDPMWDQPEVHDVYRRWHQVLAEYDGDRMAVAEAWTPTPESMARYVRADELSQAFNFAWLLAPWSASAFAEVITETLDAVQPVGRLPDLGAEQPRRRPAPDPLRRRRDRSRARPRRDPRHARAAGVGVRLPGRGARPGAGRGGAGVPAGPVLVPHRRARPRRLPGADPLGGLRAAVRVRARGPASPGSPSRPSGRHSRSRHRPTTRPRCSRSTARPWPTGVSSPPRAGETVTILDLGDDVLGFTRGPLTVVLNCGTTPVDLPDATVVFASGPVDGQLPPDTAVWLT